MKKILLAMSLGFLLLPEGRAYDDIQFQPPTSLEGMVRPGAVAASADAVYVLDSKKGFLRLYDAGGKLIKTVGGEGSSRESFSEPKGISLAPDGTVFVADTGNSHIQILGGDGSFIGVFGEHGSSPGKLDHPQSVAVGRDGRVYVADTGNDRVQVFTQEGIFLYVIGSKGKENGQLREPSRVMVDPGDSVYVLDRGNGRIQVFDPQARFVSAFDTPAADFVVDSYGFFYLLDPDERKVRERTPSGEMSGVFGSKGQGPGQFKKPAALGLAPDGALLITDSALRRLARVTLINKLKTNPIASNLSAKLLLSGPAASWKAAAQALAATEDGLVYAYLPKEGRFVGLDKEGKVAAHFGAKTGKGLSVTKGSEGFSADGKNGFFVADTEGDKVQHFDASGQFVGAFGQAEGFFDSKKQEGRVKSPRDVIVGGQGKIYVADAGNRRVEVFKADGTFLFSIGPKIDAFEMTEPVAVAWDDSGFVYILDRGLKKVFQCEPSGGFVRAWGEPGDGPGQLMDPVALAYDGRGYVYVLDRGAKRAAVFAKDGGWVTNFFAEGSGPRELTDPRALLVEGNRLIIADSAQQRIVTFALHPKLAPPEGLSASVTEGVVDLRWKPSPDAWAESYRVSRSSALEGPYALVASTPKADAKDSDVESERPYFYRVETAAKTGDVGLPSLPVKAYVKASSNRAKVEISTVEIGNIFSATYKYYETHPVGKLTLANNVNVPFENVKVTFRLKDFMDFGTDTVIPKLGPQERAVIPLKAVLNNRILDVTEDTPIQAEFTLTYFDDGKPQSVSLAKPLRVYSRNAITWDKPERLASFVTVNDTPVKDFERRILNEAPPPPESAQVLPESLMTAMRLWHALGAAGIKFQQAANNPFEEMSQNPTFPLDSTQFPRETLKRKSGQCDDLSSLMAALLEAAGVKTAFLDYPGHIALMFDTGSNDPMEIGLPESELIRSGDTLWIPVESTLIGSPFRDAHHQALNMYHEMLQKQKVSVIDPREAWTVFEPVTMPATDWSPDPPAAAEAAKRFDADAGEYAKARYDYLSRYWNDQASKDSASADSSIQEGILELDMGRRDRAAEKFQKVLESDPSNAAALNNLGGVAFLNADYAKAETWFSKAAQADPSDPGIWLNLAKTEAGLHQAAKGKEYAKKAVALDPEFQTAVDVLFK